MIRTTRLQLARTARGRQTATWQQQRQPAKSTAVVMQHPLQQMRFRSDVADIADEDKYLELKQLRDIKSEEFYDFHGQHRRYFYYVDLQGRLFLEDTKPKNIATSLKSVVFLQFFFKQIRPNVPVPAHMHAAENDDQTLFPEYPYRSPCGHELNFIKCADRPFVFEDFFETSSGSGAWVLAYGGGGLRMPFQPDKLKISQSTGRLYHDVETRHVKAGSGPASIALIKSQLAVEFGRTISMLDTPTEIAVPSTSGDGGQEKVLVIGEFEWQGTTFPVQAIE